MKEMLQILEGAFFFAVPPLLFFAFFGKRFLRPRPRKIVLWFALLVFGYTLPMLLKHNTVSRYYMPQALCLALFAGAGAGVLAQMLAKLLARPRWARWILLLLTLAVCLATALKSATSGHKPFIRPFAEQLAAEKAPKMLILGIQSSDCVKIAARINATADGERATAKNCVNWQEVIEQYLIRLPEDQEAYVLLHNKNSLPEIAMDVRTQYYSFPFEEMQSMDYRRSCFRLLHFNRKIGDGLIRTNRSKVLDYLPDPLELVLNKSRFSRDLAEFIPEALRSADDFVIGRASIFSASRDLNWSYSATKGIKLEQIDLLYFDSLYWPISRRTVNLSYPDAVAPVAPVSENPEKAGAESLLSEADPLYPASITLYGLQHPIEYFWKELAPADGIADRLTASLPDNVSEAVLEGGKLTIPPGTASVPLILKDRLLQTERQVAIRVVWTASTDLNLAEKPLKIAIVGTNDFAENVVKELQILLKQGKVDYFKLAEGIPINEESLAKAEKQIADFSVQGNYDYLVLEPFLFNIATHRNFSHDPEIFEQFFIPIWQQLQQKIPAGKHILLIPPAPVGLTVPLASNARLARMDHFRLSWLLTRYAEKNPATALVWLTGIADPEQDVKRDKQREIPSAYSYHPAACRKFAEQIFSGLTACELAKDSAK